MKKLSKSLSVITFVLMLTLSIVPMLPVATAQDFSLAFDTAGYLSISPKTIGVNQNLLVNLWVHPQPSGPAPPTTGMINQSFTGLSISFTKPDGTKDTFMPQEPGSGLPPGAAEMTGAIWFYYQPDQVGTWSVQFSFPGQTFSDELGSVTFWPCTSPTTTFTVQQDPVQIWLPPAELPGPNDYWESPVSPNNREWASISGPWLQSGGDRGGSQFNPYSKAPGTAHIVWKTQVSTGGIIGGEWGSLSYATGGGSPPIIMMGRLYHNIPGGKFRCHDLRTGEILWDADGSISMGHHLEGAPSVRATFYIQTYLGTMAPYLIGLSLREWRVYDAYTGRLVRTIENVPDTWPDESGYGGRAIVSKWRDGSPIVYCLRFAGYNITTKHYDVYEAYKWDYTQVKNNDWMTGVVWKADLKRPDTRVPGESRGHVFGGLQVDEPDGVAAFYTFNENIIAAIDLNTGAYVWNISLPYINTAYGQMGLDGNILTFDHKASQVLAYDVKTGAELWRSEAMEYPWGTNARITGPTAYGATYVYSYDGHIYAFDVNTGATKWVSDISGFTSELPYNTWAFYNNPKIADGKIFACTSEHTPTQPLPRGNRLFCIDANTGKAVWNVSGAIRPNAIAEGYLVGRSEYDGYMYVFGKGKTETSLMVGPKVIAKGSGVVIEGTVLDMSPAQAGTPAIADEDMSAWMNYKHMQRLEPGTTPNYDTWGTDVDVTGVPVELRVVHPNGNEEWISTVTSDGEGVFGHEWTPPSEGLYRIIANFTGSESYWPSKAETLLSVGPALEPSAPIEPEPTEAPLITTEVAIIIAAVAVVAVIGVAAFWILRKRE